MMIKEKECTVHRKDKDISNNNDDDEDDSDVADVDENYQIGR